MKSIELDHKFEKYRVWLLPTFLGLSVLSAVIQYSLLDEVNWTFSFYGILSFLLYFFHTATRRLEQNQQGEFEIRWGPRPWSVLEVSFTSAQITAFRVTQDEDKHFSVYAEFNDGEAIRLFRDPNKRPAERKYNAITSFMGWEVAS